MADPLAPPSREGAPPHRAHNFSAGPGALPLEVLERARRDMLDWNGTGVSVMEMSHRSAAFQSIVDAARRDLRELLGVPDGYSVLFMQGGAWTQFACVPLNLIGEGTADYVVTGGWSASAAREAARFGKVNVAASSERKDDGEPGVWRSLPPPGEWRLTAGASYVYYCANETVMGVRFGGVPDVPPGTELVADVSSCFLSEPLDVSRFAVLVAGAQKNCGPAGVTIVIARDDLIDSRAAGVPGTCPTMLRYSVMRDKGSMHNTPPCWSIYVTGLVFRWLLDNGGLEAAAARNREKADLLYAAVDECAAFLPHADRECRSLTNVVFRASRDGRTPDADLEAEFVAEAARRGMIGLKGHRSIGGLRASIYNAVPIESVRVLAAFMREFSAEHAG